MIHSALLVNTEDINQNKALDIEEFVAEVHNTYKSNAKFNTGSDRVLMMAVTSVVVSPQGVDILARVQGILDDSEVCEYLLEGHHLTQSNMEQLVPKDMVRDAKEYIKTAYYITARSCFYVTLMQPINNTSHWYIEG